MVCRRSAALLLAFAWAGLGPVVPIGDAVAAIPTLKPTPPTPLTGSPAPPHRPRPTPTPSPTPSATHTTQGGSLPMTGSDLPLELGIAGGLLAAGLVARSAGRARGYRRHRRY